MKYSYFLSRSYLASFYILFIWSISSLMPYLSMLVRIYPKGSQYFSYNSHMFFTSNCSTILSFASIPLSASLRKYVVSLSNVEYVIHDLIYSTFVCKVRVLGYSQLTPYVPVFRTFLRLKTSSILVLVNFNSERKYFKYQSILDCWF